MIQAARRHKRYTDAGALEELLRASSRPPESTWRRVAAFGRGLWLADWQQFCIGWTRRSVASLA